MNPSPHLFLLTLLAAPSFAQAVSATITTATSMVARASNAGQLVTDTLPVATVGAGSLLAQDLFGSATMSSQWWGYVDTSSGSVEWNQSATVFVPAPAFAETDPSDLLVQLQVTSAPFVAVPILLELSRTLEATAGTIVPVHRIDVGDDGSFELTESGQTSVTVDGLVVGPQGLPIRLRTQVAQTGLGRIALGLRIRIRPQNNMLVQTTVPGCSFDGLLVWPTFVGRGIELMVPTSSNPVFAVFGFRLQPQFLSPLFPVPCLLLPAPDVVMYVPTWPPIQLPLPASVRPLTLWEQGVALTPNGPVVTGGYQVTAF